ncbi:DivIVA domain-containing protein [Rhodococcus sp. IEGM 1354]|uniref:DivIVA domain-containing protein n=1 Tax=Rhodococcus sp. IEGM 1354 TaxID=3047088 RepID=UPI0024B6ECED|nr:DivIVA domain-containing protein [Rhodococcus sp. IEGM 1354]MDI9931891.1 DivIVA domain-containing protein [Rhodococcus sp. IEGM 1354]
MLTLLIYIIVIAVVAAALFFIAAAVFGRGEELGPLPEGTTATVLPAEGVTGADVRELKFQQTLRGYKPSEVDWALERLGGEIDMLRSRLSAAQKSGSRSPLSKQTGNSGVTDSAGLADGAGVTDSAGVTGTVEPDER